jgi:hypothetical protein
MNGGALGAGGVGAAVLEVSPQRIQQLYREGRLPAAAKHDEIGPLWEPADIERHLIVNQTSAPSSWRSTPPLRSEPVDEPDTVAAPAHLLGRGIESWSPVAHRDLKSIVEGDGHLDWLAAVSGGVGCDLRRQDRRSAEVDVPDVLVLDGFHQEPACLGRRRRTGSQDA